MAKNEEDFSTENIPQSNWMKFTKVGDYIKGTFTSKHLKPGMNDFKDQTVYALENCETVIDGKKSTEKEFNVGISSKYVNDRFNSLIPGTRMGIKFDKEIAAKIKGYKNAKSLLPNIFGVDPDYKSKETFKKDIDFDA